MRNERPDPLDALIDEAARRLVAGEPSSSLRSSVRDRIRRKHRKRQSAWSFVPAFAGAAVLLFVVVVVGRALLGPSAGSVGRTLSGPAVRPTSDRPATHSDLLAVASQTNHPTATQPASINARQFTRRARAVPPPPDEEPIVPPIAIEPLSTAQIVDMSSGVMPIDIAPLQIEPLLGQ